MQAMKNQSRSILKNPFLLHVLEEEKLPSGGMEKENEWMVHRLLKFHTKKDNYILCFQTETEAFSLLGMLVCQKSWCWNSSATAPVPDIFLFTQMQGKKEKVAKKNAG